MWNIFPDFACLDLWMIKHLVNRLNRTTRHTNSFQFGDPLIALAGGHDFFKHWNQFVAMNNALSIGDELWICCVVGNADGTTKGTVLGVISDGHNHKTIGGFEYLIGHNVLVRIAGTHWGLTCCHVVQVLIGEHRNMAVEQCDIEMLPQTAVIALLECGEYANRGIHACDDVRYRDTRFLWSTTREIIALTGDAHQATHTLNHEVIARALGIRTGLAKTRDRAINQARVLVLHAFIIETVLLESADFEIFHQNIAVFRQLFDELDAFWTRQINFNRTLVAVRAEIVGGFGRVVAVLIFEKRRTPRSGVIAEFGTLNFNDIGT